MSVYITCSLISDLKSSGVVNSQKFEYLDLLRRNYPSFSDRVGQKCLKKLSHPDDRV